MKIKEILAQRLAEKFEEPDFADCYLVEIKEVGGKRIEVYVDSDSGLDIRKCQQITRHLTVLWETNPEIGEKYDLEVSSPGITRPLQFPRQYVKNIGRNLVVTKKDGTVVTGALKAADETNFTLDYLLKTKEGKKTIKTQIEDVIAYDNVSTAIIKLAF
jgi:ribosome maturation factor RimP